MTFQKLRFGCVHNHQCLHHPKCCHRLSSQFLFEQFLRCFCCLSIRDISVCNAVVCVKCRLLSQQGHCPHQTNMNCGHTCTLGILLYMLIQVEQAVYKRTRAHLHLQKTVFGLVCVFYHLESDMISSYVHGSFGKQLLSVKTRSQQFIWKYSKCRGKCG